jgi:hypothetical protein
VGLENVVDNFNAEHDDDPDAIKNAAKRVEYGKYWCAPSNWRFMYGRIEDDVMSIFLFIDTYSPRLQGALEDIYMGPLIIKTFAAHYNQTTPSKVVPNYDVGVPIGSIALAVSAVSNNQNFVHMLNVSLGGTCP